MNTPDNLLTWHPLKTPSCLTRNTIHVIQLDLAAQEHPAMPLDYLSNTELERYRGIRNILQARRYLVSRIYLREVLSAYQGCKPGDIRFEVATGGKPYISSPPGNLHFNLTHTADMALVALSHDFPVGVDLEQIRSVDEKVRIARRVFSASDLEKLEQAPTSGQSELFFKLWTMMEARQKATGVGVFAPKLGSGQVGVQQLSIMDEYCAAVAWDKNSSQPDIYLFTYTPGLSDRYHSKSKNRGTLSNE